MQREDTDASPPAQIAGTMTYTKTGEEGTDSDCHGVGTSEDKQAALMQTETFTEVRRETTDSAERRIGLT